jgi:hypothetical protein
LLVRVLLPVAARRTGEEGRREREKGRRAREREERGRKRRKMEEKREEGRWAWLKAQASRL